MFLLLWVLQTVVLARLNFFGSVPALILIGVIILAVIEGGPRAYAIAIIFGLLLDFCSVGPYWQFIVTVAACALVINLKNRLVGDDYSLALKFVVLLVPAWLVLEAAWLVLGLGRELNPWAVFFRLFLTTLYSLIFVPLIYPLMEQIINDQ